ncbi:MAG: hypothetical protein AAFN30_13855 [Actinomycetota bacterium]
MVSTHGADVAIAAVNRIRSGGVAGFFCREEYEIILGDPDGGDDIAPGGAVADETPARGELVDLRVGDDDGFRHLLEEHLATTDDTERLERSRRPRPAPASPDVLPDATRHRPPAALDVETDITTTQVVVDHATEVVDDITTAQVVADDAAEVVGDIDAGHVPADETSTATTAGRP